MYFDLILIQPPSGQWDIIDHRYRKLALVIADKNEERAWIKDNTMRSDIPMNSSAYYIGIRESKGLGIIMMQET